MIQENINTACRRPSGIGWKLAMICMVVFSQVTFFSCKSKDVVGDSANGSMNSVPPEDGRTTIEKSGYKREGDKSSVALKTEKELKDRFAKKDAYGFFPEEKAILVAKLVSIAEEEGVELVSVCLRMVPEDSSSLEKHKIIARLISCFKDKPHMCADLAIKGTTGTHTESILNGLKTQLYQQNDLKSLKVIYKRLPVGKVRVSWSKSSTMKIIQNEGVDEALAWLDDMQYGEDQVAGLIGILNGAQSDEEVEINQNQKNRILALAKKHKIEHYEERLEKYLQRQSE